MFVGHYGPSFAAKKLEPSVPLWVLLVAVPFLAVLWASFVLLGIERVRTVPHFTASNALDLHYMPYVRASSSGWPCSPTGCSISSCTCRTFRAFLAPPTSDRSFALTALVAYTVFAAAVWLLDDRRVSRSAA